MTNPLPPDPPQEQEEGWAEDVLPPDPPQEQEEDWAEDVLVSLGATFGVEHQRRLVRVVQLKHQLRGDVLIRPHCGLLPAQDGRTVRR